MRALFALYLLSCLTVHTRTLIQQTSTAHEYDVIIMGAGMAGISAAKTLYDAGITNILIIEAQDYIGGRMKTIQFANYSLNGGASWIHGACINVTDKAQCSYDGGTPTEMNPMLALALQHNISFVVSKYEHQVILDFGGTVHNDSNLRQTLSKWNDTLHCILDLYDMIEAAKVEDMSFYAGLNLCGWYRPFSDIEKTVEWQKYTFEYAQDDKFASTIGTFLDTYYKYGTQDLFVTDPKGYHGILLQLASDFLNLDDLDNEPKLLLNSPIATIHYDEQGVKVTVDRNDGNGVEKYSAKYGIVTFSLGVLQSDIVEFVPTLPYWKEEALLKQYFADYTVIYVKWPYRFWSDEILHQREFIVLNDARYGFFTWIYNLDHPRMFNGSLIWRFDIALDLAAQVSMQSINDTIKELMELKLSHYFELESNETLPNPEDIFVSSWITNKYVQGSYSNYAIGVDNETISIMNWPLLKRLFFAGEAVYEDSGYVHSAFFSGIDNANEILSCMADGEICRDEYEIELDDGCAAAESEADKLMFLWIVVAFIGGTVMGVIATRHYYRTSKKDDTSLQFVPDEPEQHENVIAADPDPKSHAAEMVVHAGYNQQTH